MLPAPVQLATRLGPPSSQEGTVSVRPEPNPTLLQVPFPPEKLLPREEISVPSVPLSVQDGRLRSNVKSPQRGDSPTPIVRTGESVPPATACPEEPDESLPGDEPSTVTANDMAVKIFIAHRPGKRKNSAPQYLCAFEDPVQSDEWVDRRCLSKDALVKVDALFPQVTPTEPDVKKTRPAPVGYVPCTICYIPGKKPESTREVSLSDYHLWSTPASC